MSEIYLIKGDATAAAVSGNIVLSAPDSTFSIDFDADDVGEFGVLSFRVSVKDLKKLAANRARFLEVSSSEVRSLLDAIVKNSEEPADIQQKAKEILNGGK